MIFKLTEEQLAVRDAARDFAQTELLPGVIERDEKQEFPTAQIKKLGELGFRRHIRYDAAIHQWLSPNDNRLHGSGKKIWLELGIDYSDDPLALITFLWSLDEVMGNVSKWFNDNLQLDRLAPHVEAVADLIRGHNVEADGLYDECRWEYRFVAGLDPRGDSVSKMDGGLDGRFWNKK